MKDLNVDKGLIITTSKNPSNEARAMFFNNKISPSSLVSFSLILISYHESLFF
jgi:hypothetical protein